MRRAIAVGLALATVLLGAGVAFAYTSPGKPAGYVNDFAGVLSAPVKSQLEAELSAFAASTSNEIALVTVPSLGGDYIEHYAVELFQEWGIGNKERSNGVLLLLAMEDRELRIEVGYGLEGAIPDSVAQRIIDNDMVPLLQTGDVDGAVIAGVRSLKSASQNEYSGNASVPSLSVSAPSLGNIFFVGLIVLQWAAAVMARSRSWWAGGIVGVIAAFVVGSILSLLFVPKLILAVVLGVFGLILDYIVSKSYHTARSLGTGIPWYAGGNSGFGGGGGGFGSFGGGRSGGGGASGRW